MVKKIDDESKKSTAVYARCTQADYERYKEAAWSCRMSMAEFARDAIERRVRELGK